MFRAFRKLLMISFADQYMHVRVATSKTLILFRKKKKLHYELGHWPKKRRADVGPTTNTVSTTILEIQ